MRGRFRRGFCLPNYEPCGWWECDVFEVTAAGYFREYEVKLTLGDFKADRRKSRRRWTVRNGRYEQLDPEQKHELLAAGNTQGPSRFWYVTPPGMLFTQPVNGYNEEALLPPWAGLMEVDYRNHWWHAVEVVKAPQLHREKIADKTLRHAQSICYWRMHELLRLRAVNLTFESDCAGKAEGPDGKS
jgi:hypothetical protein